MERKGREHPLKLRVHRIKIRVDKVTGFEMGSAGGTNWCGGMKTSAPSGIVTTKVDSLPPKKHY